MTTVLPLDVVLVGGGTSAAGVEQQARHAESVFERNRGNGCPPIRLDVTVTALLFRERQSLLPYGVLPALRVSDGGMQRWRPQKHRDAYEVCASMQELLRIRPRPEALPVYVVPSVVCQAGIGWRWCAAVAISPNDYPETTRAPGAGPGIVMGIDENHPGLLVHELSHVLIDLPREVRCGDEHVRDPARVCAGTVEPVGTLLTPEECERISANLTCYRGSSATARPPARPRVDAAASG